MRSGTLLGVAVALVCVTIGTTLAQPTDKRTFFTFSEPVTIPGVTLPAGKYLFRVVDTGSRNVVQVLSENEKKAYATFFFHRATRSKATADPELRFLKTAAGMPHAIRTLWFPGEMTGYEFTYPKKQARLLAKGTGTPVLSASAATPPAVTTITPAGDELPVVENTTPSSGPTLKGEVAPPSSPVAEPKQEARAALPTTASKTPFVGLLGLVFLLGAALIRVRRQAHGEGNQV